MLKRTSSSGSGSGSGSGSTDAMETQSDGSRRPIPDPTVLTTQALLREVAALKDVVFTRLDGMDRAIILQKESLERTPSQIEIEIKHLKELALEKFSAVDGQFRSIDIQFAERDVRTAQSSIAAKEAIAAALQAQKEAVGEQNKSSALAIGKSEAATTRQIEQLGTLIHNQAVGLDGKISDLKDRLTRIESEDKGHQAAKTTQETSNTSLVAVIGLIVGIIVGFGGLAVAFLK